MIEKDRVKPPVHFGDKIIVVNPNNSRGIMMAVGLGIPIFFLSFSLEDQGGLASVEAKGSNDELELSDE